MKSLFALGMRTAHFVTQPVTGLILHNSRRVLVVILSGDKVLLQRSVFSRQRWSLPGGGIDRGETALQAAIRETKEEVGLTLKASNLTCLGERRMAVGFTKYFPKAAIVFYFVRFPAPKQPHISRPLEILDAKWFPLSDLPENHSSTVDVALEMTKK